MQIPKKSAIRNNLRLIVSSLIIILGILGYWFYKSYLLNPNVIFYGMIVNNLNTRNYTVTNYQQGLSGSLIDQTLVNTGASNIVTSLETTNISSSKTTITTLSVGIPSTDYLMYKKIDIGTSNVTYNRVLGVWGARSVNGVKGQGGQLYKSIMLAPFLFASPSVIQTNELISFIKHNHVYMIKSSKIGKLNGRPVMDYAVIVNLKQFARLWDLYLYKIGYRNQGKGIQYNGNSTANLEISVDILSRQLIALSYLGSNSIQIYGSYGINSFIKLPTKTIPLQELKDLTSSLSK
ncbi:MAG TPA: hypothetical protein VMV24_02005 [Candidatus Dormibacteraeota bacterium]|nr:hypothetical protein [Candidatus Dormibacteraeota bacterium]